MLRERMKMKRQEKRRDLKKLGFWWTWRVQDHPVQRPCGQGSSAQLPKGRRNLPGWKKKFIGHIISIWNILYYLGKSHLNYGGKKSPYLLAWSCIFLKKKQDIYFTTIDERQTLQTMSKLTILNSFMLK